MFQTLHFQQRIKRIILIDHAARRCISLMPQAATNEIEWLHSAFVFIRCTFRCIVHCINSKYSLLKKASETSVLSFFRVGLYLPHDSQEVSAPNHLYLFFCVALTEQAASEIDEFAG